ncbi:MAG: hypothetical protein ABSF82_04605 [Candidatus Bathyarchaeia archaeon]|jgi:hypothetical protein
MQYQQNFIPTSGSTGDGSGLQKPTRNIISPKTIIGSPKIETPNGTYKSVKTKNAPKTAKIPPEATSPRYITIAQT